MRPHDLRGRPGGAGAVGHPITDDGAAFVSVACAMTWARSVWWACGRPLGCARARARCWLAPFGSMVPDDVKKMANDEIAKFKAGEETIFTVFTGPLKDNTGADKVPAGTAMTDKDLLGMDWLVEGVEGSIPK